MPHIKVNGIELYYEASGPAGAPAILLIMGLATQMIAWPTPMIEGLVKAGYRVIAYDNRDIGRSTHLHGAPSPSPLLVLATQRFGLKPAVAYTLTDMARDAVGLLDALGIDRAHIVGASMGGMIAQIVAADHPARVRSLTSIMSTSGAAGLPGPAPELRRRLIARRPASATRAQVITSGAATLAMISFPDPARASDAFETMAGRAYDRGYNPAGARRQLLAILADGSRVARLKRIAAPTLVIHGAADRLVPKAGSIDIARHIPGARLEIIDAMAHDLPPSQIVHIVERIASHAATADAQKLAA